jgi:outer membrane protein assembly factor BamB
MKLYILNRLLILIEIQSKTIIQSIMISNYPSVAHSSCNTLKRPPIFRTRVLHTLSFFIIVSCSTILAQKSNDWTCFHGSDRTNKSSETGLAKSWPVNGPELLWTISGLGDGYSSISIGGERLYTAGKYDDQTYVFCYDLKGKPVWKKPNGKSWTTTLSWATSYTGSRSTPTYDNGNLYHLSESGRLTSFEAKTGKEIWARDLAKDFDAEVPEYGYSESVLIDGDNLYVKPAGKKGYQVCLNKRNGETTWVNTEIPGTMGYTSMVIMEFGGYRQIVGASSNCFYGVDISTGKLLWKVDFENQRELNLTDATCFNEYVFMTSGYGKGSMLVKLRSSGKQVIPETVWQSDLMDNHHGGVVLHNGYLYGSGSNSRGWFCLDFLTGKQMWKTDGKGSLTFADGMLYLLDERGIMKLVRATPEKYEKAGEFKVPEGGESMYWAHPVVCDGKLYIRHADKLYAYDIAGK